MDLKRHLSHFLGWDLHINALCVHFPPHCCSFCRVLLHLRHWPGECSGVWRHHLRLHGVLPKDSRSICPSVHHSTVRENVVRAGCSVCCCLGGTVSGNSVCHHDVLLGWNCPLHHVPGDDQQDNRQVGHTNLLRPALHLNSPASAYQREISTKTSGRGGWSAFISPSCALDWINS